MSIWDPLKEEAERGRWRWGATSLAHLGFGMHLGKDGCETMPKPEGALSKRELAKAHTVSSRAQRGSPWPGLFMGIGSAGAP